MTGPALHDLVVRAAAVDDVRLAVWMLGNDRHARRLDDNAKTALAAAALADGEALARTVRIGSGAAALAAELGVSVAHDDGDICIAGHIFSADYRPSPPRIRLYTRALAAIDRGLVVPGVAGILGAAQSAPMLLAHEIYHHLDLARPRSLTQRHPVTTLTLGPWHLTTEVPALAEIAAGRFAATLLGLDCHPKLLDLLLLWDSDPRRASAWTDAVEAFDCTRARKETA
jgi:hypothetical protein